MKTGRSPSYLIRNPYSYCFRIKVPKDLQAITSRKELRYSLGTGILSDAKAKARFMAGQFQLLFKKIRHMNLTKEQIDRLIKDYKVRLPVQKRSCAMWWTIQIKRQNQFNDPAFFHNQNRLKLILFF